MKYPLFFLAALGLSSCLKTPADSCTNTLLTPAANVSGPRTVAVNQAAKFIIDYQALNSCGKFLSFAEGAAGNLKAVGVQVRYESCDCSPGLYPAQATYTFTPTQAGTYYLHFSADNAAGYIADTLVVK